ncbi:MAG: Gfo/Idh/MocA family oxidoreductase [Bacillota bacterium]
MVNVAVVGCGRWGQNYVRNFSEISQARLLICCDADVQRLKLMKNRYPRVHTTRSLSEVVNDQRINAVVIATPPSTHFAIARQCLEAGKHVLVEKPFTLSSHEAMILNNLGEQNNLVVMVGHILDYHPALIKLKEYISSGELGQIYYLYANRTNLGLVREDVSVMWDLAPHDIATFMFLLDSKPTHVAMKGQAFINPGIEDVSFLTLKFASGIIGNIHVSWLDPCKVRKTTIIGEKKMIVFDDAETSEKIKIYNKGVNRKDSSNQFESFAEFQYTFSYGDVYIPKIEMTEPLRNECLHFIQCIKEGCTPRTNGLNAYEVVRVLEKAEQSKLEGGRFVPIDDSLGREMECGNGLMERARTLWRELRVVKG